MASSPEFDTEAVVRLIEDMAMRAQKSVALKDGRVDLSASDLLLVLQYAIRKTRIHI